MFMGGSYSLTVRWTNVKRQTRTQKAVALVLLILSSLTRLHHPVTTPKRADDIELAQDKPALRPQSVQ